MNKEKIRRDILKKRLSLSPEEIKNKSHKIFLNLLRTPVFLNSSNVMFYVSTRSEVQTEEMIKSSIMMGKKIFVPIIMSDSINLVPSNLIDFDKELIKGKKGIFEPKEEYRRLFSPRDLDLVILPGVAFDIEGNRIGRGLGYYDNFLKGINPSTNTIALAFEMQIVEKIPTNEKDVPVNVIITEKRIVNSMEYRISGT